MGVRTDPASPFLKRSTPCRERAHLDEVAAASRARAACSKPWFVAN
jgi:hypothetical protein